MFAFWGVRKIEKDWRMANIVPHLLKKGVRSDEEEKGDKVINLNYSKDNAFKPQLST